MFDWILNTSVKLYFISSLNFHMTAFATITEIDKKPSFNIFQILGQQSYENALFANTLPIHVL